MSEPQEPERLKLLLAHASSLPPGERRDAALKAVDEIRGHVALLWDQRTAAEPALVFRVRRQDRGGR